MPGLEEALDEALAAAWSEEARRVHRRYLLEIVEACGLCPWAERARTSGCVRERILLGDDPSDLAPSLAAIHELAADETAEILFFVYPRLDLDRARFDKFVTQVRDADAPSHPLGRIPFVLATFHPDAAPDVTHPERLVPFLRRTPDPTIQLLRAESLEKVRSGAPQGTQFVDQDMLENLLLTATVPLRERIARANLETATRMGLDVLGAKLDAIKKDRDAAYAPLADRARRA